MDGTGHLLYSSHSYSGEKDDKKFLDNCVDSTKIKTDRQSDMRLLNTSIMDNKYMSILC